MKRKSAKIVLAIMIIALAFAMSSCSGKASENDKTIISNLFGKSEYEKIYDAYANKMEEAAERIRKECLAAEKEITDKDESLWFTGNKSNELIWICFEGQEAMLDNKDDSEDSVSEYEKWSTKLFEISNNLVN